MTLDITGDERQQVHHLGRPDEQGHRLSELKGDTGGLWSGHVERFLSDPAEEPDNSQWVTDPLFKTT